jgi:cytochrome c-type biogenesis protein CcmE
MKKTHLLGILVIAVAVAILMSISGDVSTYATFEQAVQSGERVKVVCQLSKDKEMVYNPVEDPNRFTFFAKDDNGLEKKVVLLRSKPQDIEMSESVVITGEMQGEDFVANDILLKCPSKYKDEEIQLRKEQKGI